MADRPALDLLPRPQRVDFGEGECPPFAAPQLHFGGAAAALVPLLERQWAAERRDALRPVPAATGDWVFSLGAASPAAGPAPTHAQGYRLTIDRQGLTAAAGGYQGLLYAWQAVRQLLRQFPHGLPALTIEDEPDLTWRIYHLDLKGTRRRLDNLYTILPRLAELRVNGLLAEYEDYLRLDRHPDLAVPEALTQEEVRDWIAAAREYGIAVIPLVQTLGHWQYVLSKPAYAHLAETPGDVSEACATLPGTWALVSDFLDEILDLHPDAPFIHIGLDETAHIATCPRCQAHLAGRPRHDVYVDWVNRVGDYVRAHGQTPMVWGDIVVAHLTDDQRARLNRQAVFVDWGYNETGPTAPWVTYRGGRVSRQWLQRPQGETWRLPTVPMSPGSRFYEDLSAEDQAKLRPLVDNPAFPLEMKTGTGATLLRQLGFRFCAVSGVRVSFHGNLMPEFTKGHLNSRFWANTCRELGAEGLIMSSWSRGHSLAGMNAHPELDWYGLAGGADAAWAPQTDLRDFDRRFGRQFFGLPDGTIGDLYFGCDRSSKRVDHVMTNYYGHVAAALPALLAAATRNRDCLELFAALVELQQLRIRGQFSLLEIEYFYAMWTRVPPAMRRRILADMAAVMAEIERALPRLQALYGQTIIARDAEELARTQLDFLRDSIALMRDRLPAPAPGDR